MSNIENKPESPDLMESTFMKNDEINLAGLEIKSNLGNIYNVSGMMSPEKLRDR